VLYWGDGRRRPACTATFTPNYPRVWLLLACVREGVGVGDLP
jgi:hypothetical protein